MAETATAFFYILNSIDTLKFCSMWKTAVANKKKINTHFSLHIRLVILPFISKQKIFNIQYYGKIFCKAETSMPW